MRIEINEFIKIFTKKTILLILLGLTILNGAIIINNNYNKKEFFTYYPNDYKAIYNDLSGYTNKYAFYYLEKQSKELTFALNPQNEKEAKLKYTDSAISENILISDVKSNIDDCLNYDKYLDDIKQKAEIAGGMSIFAKPDSFSYKNIQVTPKDFEHMKGTQLKFGPSKGITGATDNVSTDVIAIIFILIVIMTLITREKEFSQLQLCKTTYKGRIRLAVSKLIIILISCVIVEGFLYGTNFLLSYISYGFGDLSRPIQSVTGFISCNLSITVFEYFILFLLAKLMVYFLIASLIYLIAVASKNAMQVYIVLAAFFGISSILYYTIEPTSWLSLLKYLNFASFINTSKIFQSYLNLNFFGSPLNYIPVFIVLSVSLFLIFSYLSIVLFSEQKSISNSKYSLNLKFIKTYKNTSIFLHECYKILISGKVLLILLIFGLIVFANYKPIKESFMTYDDVYYKAYMQKLEGPVDDKKLGFINDEQNRFNTINENIQKAMAEDSKSADIIMQKYQNDLKPYEAFKKVNTHTEYLVKKNGDYVYDTGYKLLTGHESSRNKDKTLAIMAIALVICCLTYVYSVEYQNKANILLKCSYNGRGKTFFNKLIISTVVVIVIFALTYAPYFYNVLTAYGTNSLSSPACSMEHLSNIPLNISIIEYFVIISALRFLGMILAMLTIFFFSIRLKSYISALLASTGVLILPLIFSLLGIKIFDYILITPLLIGNVFS